MKIKKDDEKFAHLNIAWEKYKIVDPTKSATGTSYDFYCSLCNKYMQRKMQLVDVSLKAKKKNELFIIQKYNSSIMKSLFSNRVLLKIKKKKHLKSKKHHRKIYEKKSKDAAGGGAVDIGPKPQFNKKPGNQANKNFKKPINFVPSQSATTTQSGYFNNQKKIDTMPNYSNYNSVNNNFGYAFANQQAQKTAANNNQSFDYTGGFSKAAVQKPTTTAYPASAFYQNQQNLQPNFKRKSNGLSNISNNNKSDDYEGTNAKFRRNNESVPIGNNMGQSSSAGYMANTAQYGSYNTYNPIVKSEWATPASYTTQSNVYGQQQQQQVQQTQQAPDLSNYGYGNMFPNMNYMQFATNFNAMKPNNNTKNGNR